MPARVTPSLLLSAAIALGAALATVALALAVNRPWLGLDLTRAPELDLVWVRSVDAGGPSAAVAPSRVLVAITGSGGDRIAIRPEDLVEEPDTLGTYAAMRQFFDRQEALSAALAGGPVTIETETPLSRGETRILPAAQRPIGDLPAAFWVQIGVGLAGFWIGTWVWALRRGDWATRFLAIAGAGLMTSACAAAVYSTRELALPGALFRVLSGLNLAGALVFGVGMIGLFLIYPRRLVARRWLAAPALVFGAWLALDLAAFWSGPGTGRHLPVLLAMLAIVALIAIQFRATRGHPRDRAALTWLGLAVIVGGGAFVATVIAPVVLGIGPLMSQGQAFLFFLLIYVGVALGVGRFQLFQLDEWAFRILFYVFGVVLLLVIDAALILTIVDERAPAFALSLLIVALVWLPLRDTLARISLRRHEPERSRLFRQVMDLALSPPGHAQQARWRELLEDLFNPLAAQPCDPVAAPALLDDGLGLVVPGCRDLPGFRLDHASAGRRLFSTRDLDLAAEVSAMLASALDSRESYEKGVVEERMRIARDIHDNIGVQLMGALHSREAERKDTLIRETLTDLRDIINNASNPDLSLDEMLADLRSQISEHLFAAGVRMKWDVANADPAILPLTVAHTVRSVIREAVQNALRHGRPGMIEVGVRRDGPTIRLTVHDDGPGFDPATFQPGNGLANMQGRVVSLGGTFTIASGAEGTRIDARLPLDGGRSARP